VFSFVTWGGLRHSGDLYRSIILIVAFKMFFFHQKLYLSVWSQPISIW